MILKSIPDAKDGTLLAAVLQVAAEDLKNPQPAHLFSLSRYAKR